MTRQNVSDQDVGLALDPELRALPNPPLAATYDEERRTEDSEFVSTQHELQLKPARQRRARLAASARSTTEENNSIRFDVDVRDDRGAVPGAVDRRRRALLAGVPAAGSHARGLGGFRTAHLALLSDALRASVGARYTEDTKQDRHGINLVCPTPNATIGERRLQSRRHRDRTTSRCRRIRIRRVPVPGTCRITTHNDAEKIWSKITYMARLEYDLSRWPARVRAHQHRVQVRRDPGRRHVRRSRKRS